MAPRKHAAAEPVIIEEARKGVWSLSAFPSYLHAAGVSRILAPAVSYNYGKVLIMAGINSKHGAFGGIPAVSMKNNKELASLLGTNHQTISATKSLRRGLSPELAKSVATKSGEKPATLYVVSQIASIKSRIKQDKISPSGALSAVRDITVNLRGKFASKDFDRNSPEYQRALLEIKQVAETALDLGGNPEPVNSTGDSVAAALKTERDVHGRHIPEGDPIERDTYGRVLKD